ncbi:MAG: hypothetical protein A3G34_14510 [Candidatus Lindowbacteria bacterium RIFCSPLOWO2_12_FULL_62_27]|nr:MAG: hypothetical protein A3I06_15920 [Candidatus Lindowbacteria bacterium RIFCSPLOWO2_02_FULL_62_12]OGH63315.1 MAG: hypothetical protein A3G34_14510 [Candidatus Lindowbacteria bacterium RIFCSPLOWO2_12_FULL_62_27]
MPWDADSKLAVVSKSHPRINAADILTGRARFATDIKRRGMLYAKILRCPYGHAKVGRVTVPDIAGVRHVEKKEGKECFFAGDDVAIVVADTQEIAEEAGRRAEVDYEILPHAVTMEDAIEGPGVFRGGNRMRAQTRDEGDVDQGLKEAAVVLERTYKTQAQTHSCLEPHSAVAEFNSGGVTVWTSTQSVQGNREQITEALDLSAGQVRVIAEYVGGGFGSKFGAQSGATVAELSRKLDAPVKLLPDRAEEHAANGNRPPSIQKVKAGIRKDGVVTAWIVDSYGSGGYAGGGGGPANPLKYLYPFTNWRKTHVDVRINGGAALPFRAPGHPQGVFAIESMIDELAARVGMDPLEVRKKNDTSPVRRAQFDAGAKRIGWSRRAQPTGSEQGPLKHGIGMAGATWGGQGGPPAEITAVRHADGTFEFHSGAQDIGTGIRTAIAVIAAEELGVRPADIKVKIGDSDLPYGPGSGGSVTAPSVLPAVREAAHKLKQEIAKQGAGAPGGKITVTGSRPEDFRRYRGGVAGCQFAEVEVDTETGMVRVLKVVAVQDCGRIVNRLTAESQIQGGVLQGISYALFEERVLDRQKGAMLNADFLNYKILGPRDTPDIDVVLFEVSNAGNTVGLLGLGEPPTVPTAAAVANAVANAIGARIYELPITPDKVLGALNKI